MRSLALVLGVLVACGNDHARLADAGLDGPGADAVADGAVDALSIDGTQNDGAPIDGAPIDAVEVDAAAIDAPATDAAAIDAPSIDAPVDAPAIDAPVDAPPPFLSPSIDLSYGAGGLGCADSRRLYDIGLVTATVNGIGIYVAPDFPDLYVLRRCGLGGTVVNRFASALPPTWAELPSGRFVGHPFSVGLSSPPELREVMDLTDFVSVVSANGHVDFLRGAAPVRRWDVRAEYVELPQLPPMPTFVHAWSCGAASTHYLVQTSARTMVRVDTETWALDPSFGIGGEVVVPAAVAVGVDCAFVTVTPTAGQTQIQGFDVDGRGAPPFLVPLAEVGGVALDPHGRLVVGLPTTTQFDLRVARIDVRARSLDPAFGLGGIAELDHPGLTQVLTPPVFFNILADVLVAPDHSILLRVLTNHSTVVPPPMGAIDNGIVFVRLNVAD